MRPNDVNPLVSIVIPTYNHADFIARCLDSVCNQTVTDWEAIVINNFSEDNTVDIVTNYNDDRIKLINFRNNGVIAASRNEGIRYARAEWICFLDSDDWWYPEKLATVLKKAHVADVIYHYAHKCGPDRGKGPVLRVRQLRHPVFSDLMIKGNSLLTSATCVRKSILDEVGGFCEDRQLIAVEDYDLWLRIAGVTERFVLIPTPLAAYWVDGGNLSTFSEKQIEREVSLHSKYSGSLVEGDRCEAEKLLAYKTGLSKEHLGMFDESRSYFKKSLKSRYWKRKVYSLMHLLTVSLKSRLHAQS